MIDVGITKVYQMSKSEKIAQCSAEGDFSVEPNIFDGGNLDFRSNLFSTSNTKEWFMLKLAYAEYCLKRGDERDAFYIYSSILNDVIINGHIKVKYKDIAFDAYNAYQK